MTPLELYLEAQIPSGKNQIQLSTRGGHIHKYPNKRFTAWREQAATEILSQVRGVPMIPKTTDIFLSILYHPLDRRVRDVSGMLDALFHLLMYTHILEDDGQIKGVYWSPPPLPTAPSWCVAMRLEAMGVALTDDKEEFAMYLSSTTRSERTH